MKTILSRSSDYLALAATYTLAGGVGFLFVCMVNLYDGRTAAAKQAWDVGTGSLIAGCLLGAAACKCSQVRRELNQ
jgi:hypothetical protein